MRKLVAVLCGAALCGCLGAGVEQPPGAGVAGEPDSGNLAPDARPGPDAAPAPDAVPLGDGVHTLAGSAEPGNADGPRNVARFDNPVNVALASTGDLYVADFDNSLLRVVAPDGYVTTLTEQEEFRRPFGLTFAPDGALFAQIDWDDQDGHGQDSGTIWKVDTTTGAATVVARAIGRPRGLLALPDGRLLLIDMIRHDVRLLDPDSGEITPLAGAAQQAGFADGKGAAARFNRPYDAVLAEDGSVLIADLENHRIRRLTLDGQVTTYAGTGAAGTADGPAASATFDSPCALAIDDAGTVYVTDTGGYVIRAISAGGEVTTVAGDRQAGFRDGDPLQARFFGLEGLAVTGDGSVLYVADGNRGSGEAYHRVRRVTLP